MPLDLTGSNLFFVLVLFGAGLFCIMKGGDLFVDAATWIAESTGIPKFIIGATVVSFATTMPELLVSLFSAFEGNADIAVGNAVGSVTANTGLILCISLVCMQCAMTRRQYAGKACLLLSAICLLFVFTRDGSLSLWESAAILAVFGFYMAESLLAGRREQGAEQPAEKPKKDGRTVAWNIGKFVLGAGAIIEKKPNMFAIGLIENAYHQTCRIEAIPAGRILEEEPPLLDYAKSRMAKIPFDQADILFVDETGKDISGAGMDPNVTGRSPVLGISRPFFQRIAVFDLTDKSHGNFGGLGSADVTTQRLYRKIDFEQTYPNGITAAEPLAVRLPVIMPSDRTAMQFALRTATDCDWSKGPRIVWLKNTLSLSEFYISEALIPDAEALDNVTVVSEPMDVIFDEEGNVKELR